MQLALWQRLFLAIAALSGVALAGLAIWQQQGFRRGFLGYLDEVALERLQPAANRLAANYVENGGWAALHDNDQRFAALIEPDVPRFPRAVPLQDPTVSTPTVDALTPPRASLSTSREVAERDRAAGSERLGPPILLSRLLLLDLDGTVVVGNREIPRSAAHLAIEVDDERIGTLYLQSLPQLLGPADVAFAREQRHGALIAGIAMLAAALVLAFALARWLLDPVRALAEGTRALAAGDYTRRINQKRHDEFGALAHDFNHLAMTLEQHREARRRWGADIAHELRTPLSILRGEIQALQDGVRAPNAQALASLNAECERLGGLVEDLYQLALADVGALEYRFEELDLGELVRESTEMHRHTLADVGLVLDESIEPIAPVRADARRLGQLIDNLLDNARRYTDAPGRILVRVEPNGTLARLVVEDTAPGVPLEAMPHLFERLFRLDRSRSRAVGGAGLGLAICRAIVAAHDGDISASASTLGGLRITVELPLVERVA
ncbi:MAG: ATP-binding protein [Dokdonella sp.]